MWYMAATQSPLRLYQEPTFRGRGPQSGNTWAYYQRGNEPQSIRFSTLHDSALAIRYAPDIAGDS